ncbi:MAG: hypothetical protein CMO01_28260 [Thalassobius sp.]|nr:hypothetical protein [Thalassovita sp.]
MKKIPPKGIINKQISIKLTEAELSRFKAFCKVLDMSYSDVFRAMCNQIIKKETRKRGIDLKAHEPEIIFNPCKFEPAQLDIFKDFIFQESKTLTRRMNTNINSEEQH